MSGIVTAVALVLVAAAVPTDTVAPAPPITITAVNRAAPFVGALTLRISTGDLTRVLVQDTRYDQPGWTLTGQIAGRVPVLTAGGDAEGTVTAGPAFAGAAAGSGLGTTRVGASTGALTLTLTSL